MAFEDRSSRLRAVSRPMEEVSVPRRPSAFSVIPVTAPLALHVTNDPQFDVEPAHTVPDVATRLLLHFHEDTALPTPRELDNRHMTCVAFNGAIGLEVGVDDGGSDNREGVRAGILDIFPFVLDGTDNVGWTDIGTGAADGYTAIHVDDTPKFLVVTELRHDE